MREFKKYFSEHEFHLLTIEEFSEVYQQIGKDFSNGLTTWEKVIGHSSYKLQINQFNSVRIWRYGSIEFRNNINGINNDIIFRENGFAAYYYNSKDFYFFENSQKNLISLEEAILKIKNQLRIKKLENILQDEKQ